MSSSLIDLPPNVKEQLMVEQHQELKGCRVKITVDEPGFSDARVMLKFPHGEIKSVLIGPGDTYEFICKPHLVNQIILEGQMRDGDPPDPDLEGGY